MHRSFLVAAIALVGMGSALAADLPPPILKAPPALTAASAWSNLYIGASVFGAKTKDSFDFVTIPGTGNLHPTGVMPGLVVGAGFWYGPAWLGVEADAAYDFIKTDNSCVVVLDCRIKNSFFLTQRAIVGVALPAITGAIQNRTSALPAQWPQPMGLPASAFAAQIMPYLTVGVAERRIEACIDSPMLGISQGCAKEWIVGLAYGGGIRIPVSQHTAIDVSYLHASYNKSFVPASGVAIFPGAFQAKSENAARAALIFHY